MLTPGLPSNEAERLINLQELKILDTPMQTGFERITRLATQLFKVSMAAISLVDQDRVWFKSIQGLDICESPRETSFCGHAILQDNVFYIPDVLSDPRFFDNPSVIGAPNIRFYAGYPIKETTGNPLGTMCIFDYVPRNISPSELAFLQDLAALAEGEIHKYKMAYSYQEIMSKLDQAYLASMVDPLTQIWNRKGLDYLLKHQMNKEINPGDLLGVALIDIDDFKKINDTHGHLVGDKALKSVAKCLVNFCGNNDAVGRWGGEEFLILISAKNQKYIIGVLEQIRLKIEKLPIVYSKNKILNLTVTMGVTVCSPSKKLSPEILVSLADKALYRGKITGKNCIQVNNAVC